MSYESNIQWTDSTWNPWYGCIKVSEGCKNCYMYRDFDRWKKDPRDIQRSKTKFNDPLKWADPRMIFTCSLSDFFIEEADQWRAEVWDIINRTPQHFYQILTKRPERIERCLPIGGEFEISFAPKNTILMLSVSTQNEFETTWPIMENLARLWRMKVGLSLEPLLGPIDLTDWLEEVDIGDEYPVWSSVPSWVIIGGESGHTTGKYKYRACEIDWLVSVINQCQSYGVPVFLKQLGSHLAKTYGLKHPHGGDASEKWHGEYIRQFPTFMAKWQKTSTSSPTDHPAGHGGSKQG